MFNQLQKNIQKYFGISRAEANGIIVLIILLIVLVISPLLYRRYATGGYQNYEKDLALLDSLSGILWTSAESILSGASPVDSYLIPFDPNEVTFSQMIRMGFDTILARRIISYRNRGGIFHESPDLMKIYDFPETLYNQINHLIRIPENENTFSGHEETEMIDSGIKNQIKQEWILLRFDLNEADTAQLISVKGIGPVFSRRIIKYRDLLGGYVSTEQLREVYGLRDETLLYLKECVFVDSLFEPEKIRLNFSTWEELVKHPYIHSELANRILNIRSMDGPYLDANDFIRRLDLPDSLRINLIPYCEF